jgi:endonuclease/exonuclease/phosphatase family metal-dependent hydrolase
MEKSSGKRSIFHRTFFLLNAVAAVLLFVSQLMQRMSPAKLWWAELLALSYPYLLLLNIAFIIYWLFKRYRFALLSFFVILSGYNCFTSTYQLPFKGKTKTGDSTISVLSYNVRLFDLYNWTGNVKTRTFIFDWLKERQPDIICFQEYYNGDKGDFQNTAMLKGFLKAKNAHVEYGVTLRKTDHWGLATFTSFPVVGKGRVIYEEGQTNFGIYTDVKINNDTLRIYNVHLQSNHFKEKDYKFIESPDSGSNEEIYNSSKNILRRLKAAAVKRAQQVDELKMHINNSPYHVILCGDFNDPPFSYAYHVLSEGLTDTFREKGSGMGITYIGKIPFFRIDYLLHDDKLKCISHSVPDIRFSDHKPLFTELEIINSKF